MYINSMLSLIQGSSRIRLNMLFIYSFKTLDEALPCCKASSSVLKLDEASSTTLDEALPCCKASSSVCSFTTR